MLLIILTLISALFFILGFAIIFTDEKRKLWRKIVAFVIIIAAYVGMIVPVIYFKDVEAMKDREPYIITMLAHVDELSIAEKYELSVEIEKTNKTAKWCQEHPKLSGCPDAKTYEEINLD